MKLTRVILLALAFAIPTMSTTIASAEDAPAAAGEEKPAKGKKGKKAKKDKKEDKKAEEPAK